MMPWKYIGITAAILLLLVAIYFWGRSNGYDKGYESAFNAQQLIINACVKREEERRLTLTNRIKELELEADALVQQLDEKQEVREVVRTEIVTKWIRENPEVTNQCGISPNTGQLINNLLNAR